MKNLHINLPIIEVVTQMPSYSKFLKDILTNKRKLNDELITLPHQVSALVQHKMPKKQKDPGSFTLPVKIGNMEARGALADLGAKLDRLGRVMMSPQDPMVEALTCKEEYHSQEAKEFVMAIEEAKKEEEDDLRDDELRDVIGYSIEDIKGISPSLCMHRIHLKDDQSTSIEPQRRLNPNLQEVIKKEILKLREASIIYAISDSKWVSPVHVVTKKGGMTIVKGGGGEEISTRTVTRWRICIDYKRFFQIPIHPNDQEKTNFMCPYGTFAYRRMPFGLCNARSNFQRCMTSIFSEMLENEIEVFMDDFSVGGSSLTHVFINMKKF
ncbi:uncharacterized protein LOC110717003 [Chenopodium quinoa]|uniref:uncharacterized protein LOC110717003 n=1 Tax=Chenopodium quinoa TaxID=63459 RepID=UPI000B78A986|nr:uncharacterized protein LOC110717003 [Chenopodium quinoa]